MVTAVVTTRLKTETADVTLQANYRPLGHITLVWLEGQWAASVSRVAPPKPEALRGLSAVFSLTEPEAVAVAECAVLLWQKLEELDRLIERVAEALLFPTIMAPVRADAVAELASRLETSAEDVATAMGILDEQRRIKVGVREGDLYWWCDMPPMLGSGAYSTLLHARAA